MEIKIRKAEKKDVSKILEIVNYEILNSTVVYDYKERTYDYQFKWFQQKLIDKMPVIVAESKEEVVGFGTFGIFRPWEAYKFSVEHSIYVSNNSRAKGIGKLLLTELINSSQGYIEVIPHPEFLINAVSIRALRSLLVNLELSDLPQLLVKVECENKPIDDFNQNLIRYTSQAMSSILGGVEVLMFDVIDQDVEKQRLLRNIPNLMQLEAGLNQGEDALSGGRNFEYMVDEISSAVWDKLNDL